MPAKYSLLSVEINNEFWLSWAKLSPGLKKFDLNNSNGVLAHIQMLCWDLQIKSNNFDFDDIALLGLNYTSLGGWLDGWLVG